MKKPLYSQDDILGGYALSKKKQDNLLNDPDLTFEFIEGKIMYTPPQVTKLLIAAGRIQLRDKTGHIFWGEKINRATYILDECEVIEE